MWAGSKCREVGVGGVGGEDNIERALPGEAEGGKEDFSNEILLLKNSRN
jgi:hypothetical protein